MRTLKTISAILVCGLILSSVPCRLFAQEDEDDDAEKVIFMEVPPVITTPSHGGNEILQNLVNMIGKKRDIVPVYFYTPETQSGFGVSGVHLFSCEGSCDPTRPSSLRLTAVGTTTGQRVFSVAPEIYFNKGEYIFRSALTFLTFKDRFYGLGEQTVEGVYETFGSQDTILTTSLLRRISPKIYAGLVEHFRQTKILSVSDNGLPVQGDIPGSQDANVSSLGVTVIRDTRNNIFEPSEGSLCSFTSSRYDKIFGSDYEFMKSTIDLRKYFPCFTTHVLAIEGLAQWVNGDVPFQDMPYVGGQNVMRGYYMGRFRDNDMMFARWQYRMPLYWRFHLAFFEGFAALADRFSDFRADEIKEAHGFGIRYMVDPDNKINIRLDFGFTPDSAKTYLTFLEAF
jgi:hypothetical protein